jgi:hypothetical protein
MQVVSDGPYTFTSSQPIGTRFFNFLISEVKKGSPPKEHQLIFEIEVGLRILSVIKYLRVDGTENQCVTPDILNSCWSSLLGGSGSEKTNPRAFVNKRSEISAIKLSKCGGLIIEIVSDADRSSSLVIHRTKGR